MDSTTMTKNAARCVASARLRVDGRLVRAAVRVPAQGTAVSVAGPITGVATGLGTVRGAVAWVAAGVRVDATVPFTGEVSARAYSAFTATDVVRSPSGRPPV